MSITPSFRRLAFALLSSCTLSTAFVVAPAVLCTTTVAHAQAPADFDQALEPYGEWVRHPRWGMVWIPDDRPRGWRPYTEGHWVYTDDWGWYWISDGAEQDWGWVTYHYGRWVLDRRMGWIWVPGEEWAPAWVDWRRGGDYVGWAPAPPDDVIYEYDDNPSWWIFVAPRYLTSPRIRTYVVPPQRTTVIIRQTVVVNRTVIVQQGQQRRFAVNPGIAPNVVAAISRQPVQTFRVAPRVLPVTQGVQGAVTVQPQALGPRGGRNAPGGTRRPPPNPQVRVSVQPTNQTVAPAATVTAPQALPKTERGRLGDRPPRAAQGAQQAPPPAAPSAPAAAPAPAPSQQPAAPAARPATPAPAAQPAPPPPQPGQPPRPQRPSQSQSPPPAPPAGARPQPPAAPLPAAPAAPKPAAPPAPPPPAAAKPPAPPPAARPAPPPPPAIQHAPPPARPAPPPAARPAPPPPPPAAARPAPPPPAAAKPAPKPGEKPEEKK